MASQNWGVLQTTCSCTQLYANCVTPGLSFCRGQQVSEGAAGGGERAPGHPSTHPAEGCDQGQQSGRNAVLVQGGAVLRQGRELLGPAPHSPTSQQAPPLATVPEPPAPAAQGCSEGQGRTPWHPAPTRVLCHPRPQGGPAGRPGSLRPPPGPRRHLQAAVHHAHDEVELLVVQHGAVLLRVQVQLLRQAAAGRAPLQGPQHGREQLGEGERRADGTHRHGARRPRAGAASGGAPQRPQEWLAGALGARAQALSTETQAPARPGVPRLRASVNSASTCESSRRWTAGASAACSHASAQTCSALSVSTHRLWDPGPSPAGASASKHQPDAELVAGPAPGGTEGPRACSVVTVVHCQTTGNPQAPDKGWCETGCLTGDRTAAKHKADPTRLSRDPGRS